MVIDRTVCPVSSAGRTLTCKQAGGGGRGSRVRVLHGPFGTLFPT